MNKILRLIQFEDFKVPEEGTVLPLRFLDRAPFVKARVGNASGYFGVDTGSSENIALFAPFVEDKKSRDAYKPWISTVTGVGIGGIIEGDLVRFPTLTLGEYRTVNVLGEFSRQTEGGFADDFAQGNIGGGIWKRFTTTLDYKHGKLYLKPNALFGEPFDGPNAGLAVFQGKVVSIARNSPAQEAGIIVGDQVLAVNGKPIDATSIYVGADEKRSAPGTKVQLKLRAADGMQREVTLILRDLI